MDIMHAYEKEHLAALRPHLAECTLFLRRSGAFPLSQPGQIALYGAGVRHTLRGGTGSGEVNVRHGVTVEEGFIAAGFTVTTGDWLDSYDRVLAAAKKRFYGDLRAKAAKSGVPAIFAAMGAVMPEPEYDLPLNGAGDTAIYVLSRISGEGSDRAAVKGDIFLSDTEKRDILALQAKYPRFLLALNVGGPVELLGLEAVTDILLLSQLGTETGAALADIVLGKANPSGKLSTTWAGWRVYCRAGDFGEAEETRYREGIYVGYRWFDSAGIAPTFPFGFGLGYCDFALDGLAMACEGRRLRVSARLTNGGALPGRETLQVYVSSPAGALDQPYQALAAFRKSAALAPGASETVTCEFDFAELASYDPDRAAWVLEAGDYGVRAGTSSRDTALAGVVTVPETIVVRQVKNLFGKPDFEDWKPEKRPAAVYPAALPRYTVTAADIPTESVDYALQPSVEPECAAASDADLARVCVGLFREGAGLMDTAVGNSAFSVAGAAGESVPAPAGADVPPLVMADGPAGLRLSRQSFRDAEGVHLLTDAIPESMLALLPAAARFYLRLRTKKPKDPAQIVSQYCTAIPIGTAVAQSWDPGFARLCGELVGEEMARFGVNVWLAPALNIHRDIRCGRNFEYYSEDPLLSGKIAAGITAGVQARPGCAVTIKHFAANNQELNRTNNNSRVSERALREIYLRGFAVCIREAQPKCLMTSYNLLGGVHTSSHRALVTDALRCELGYAGVVMSDWIAPVLYTSQKYRCPTAAENVAAGGDLFMPGRAEDVESILGARQAGILPRRALEESASRVVRLCRALGDAQNASGQN
jgi:beta-glucosidase